MEPPNVINGVADPESSYTTTNLAEAVPGISTPLNWSIWGPAADHAARYAFYSLGVVSRPELQTPTDPRQRVIQIFYGRVATRIDYFCEMGDRIPGTTGSGVARDAFDFMPPNFVSRPSKHRYPFVLAKMPRSFLTLPRTIAAVRRETDEWWHRSIARSATLDVTGAAHQLLDAKERFHKILGQSAAMIVVGVQPVYQQLVTLATEAGVDPSVLMRSHGAHEETLMIQDLWSVSRDRMSLDDFLRRHGFHGPSTGEVSQRSWREDRSPLAAIIENYRQLDDAAGPVAVAAEGARLRVAAERRLVAEIRASQRPAGRLVIRLAGRYFPLRASAKLAFTRALDVARGSARRAGTLLAADGTINDPEDIFYLTAEEIAGEAVQRAGLKDLIAERQALRERYSSLELPVTWHGEPTARPISDSDHGQVHRLSGTGVSGGIAEGTARVVTDPADTEMDEGDILVAHTTDPSWASVMFLAAGLVVDIGGQLSHAAVVARELGIPCVMGTANGTRALRTGDRIRVDGNGGTVEVLERADRD